MHPQRVACHPATCYPAPSFQQPATCIRNTWHKKWPGGMREAFKSATPRFPGERGVLDSLQALLLNRKSPIPISISNLKFQSQFPIPSQFPFSISILKSLPRRFEKETCKPPPTRGGTPPPAAVRIPPDRTILTGTSAHFGSKIADQLFRRGPLDLFGRCPSILKPPRTLPKPEKFKNQTFNLSAGFTSKIVMVRTLAAPKGTPGAQKRVGALTWRANRTTRRAAHPSKKLCP